MQVTRKDAAISAPVDDAFPGSFEAILSAPTKDRDGETLLPEEWKQPLPEHITVDRDHEMTVAGTIGSAKPWIDEKGNLRISGTFASTAKAQEVRTLMQEGHIRTTSVAFMSEKTQKDGVTTVARELLNAGIVAIPSNREALVLSAKGLKAGARNSKEDQVHLDAIARHAIALGANIATGGDSDGNPDVAAGKSLRVKDADTEDATDPAVLAAATDAALDEAINLLATVDPTTLPAAIQQAIALIQAADATVDELLDALGIPDPDEDADSAAPAAPAAATAAAPKAAATAAAEVKGAAVEDDSFDPIAARQRYYAATLSEGN